ncbi:MAG TPA: gephyrin-like molybdotransferase Glp, partial [Anaerolineae bacterium]|nr:gephyrin-like molybdotransferase Glp [Anaerolineae bacterium]
MPLPSFPRSTMDGYAVRAADTFGASEALPAYLKVIGESPMGRAPSIELNAGQTAIIHTGGMMPSGADAVVMIERTQKVTEAEIEVLRAVAPGENVLHVGEDVKPNELLLPIGHVLRPQDLGGLMAMGVTSIKVARRPRVGILATGDEVIDPHTVPQAGQVRDVNTYTLKGLIERSGCVAQSGGIIRDDFDHLVQAARSLIDQCDALVLSAGSSVSVRDMTSDVINQLGQPGVLVHGISIKPGKPTILAVCNGKPVFGLPGNPVSALVVGDLFITPTLWRMQGCDQPPTRQAVQARLAHNLSSVPGRVDYIQVKLIERAGETWAEPIFGKSNLIYTLVKSDGMLIIPIDATGLQAGELVEVRLF